MKIDHSKTKGYVIHKVTDNNYCVCRILNEYESLDEAQKALVGLLSKNVTEEELLEEMGKQGNGNWKYEGNSFNINKKLNIEEKGQMIYLKGFNIPIDKTLRLVKEDSLSQDDTENLYIEWDNLEVLKLLQESYLGKTKCIYTDIILKRLIQFNYPNPLVS